MPETRLPVFFFLFAVITLIFGSAAITVILLQPVNYAIFSFTSPLIGSLYIATCVLGICAVFYSKKCQATFMFPEDIKSSKDQSVSLKTVPFKAHHPYCYMFSANRIKIRKTFYCAACSGLLVGAIVALVGAFFYFFVGYNFLWSNTWIFVVSNVGMLLGLFQFRLAGFVKLAANAFFVMCSLLMLVMVDLLGKSLVLDLYVFGLIVFFLAIRILLSEFNNKRICHKCKQCF